MRSQYSGGGSRYRLPRRSLEIITYTSRCYVRKAKPHLQLILARDTKCSKKSFYHYTSTGRKNKRNAEPLLSGLGDLVETGKAEVLNAFNSLLTSKISQASVLTVSVGEGDGITRGR